MKHAFNTKIDERKFRALQKLSAISKVPQSRLVEEALDLLFTTRQADVVDAKFLSLVRKVVAADLPALKILAQ